MKLNSSELEIKNKKFAIKYGLILLGVSLLLLIFFSIIEGPLNINIPIFFRGIIVVPFPVFLSSWILMIISYQIQIITNLDFSRNLKNENGTWNHRDKGDVVKIWFYFQSLLGFCGYYLHFGLDVNKVNNAKIENNDILIIFLISISPTILFIISSYFARLNRIENKIDILLKEKEENQNG